MIYTRARTEHLEGINQLLKDTGQYPILTENYIKYDISVVALDGAKVVGFIWAGLMANKKLAYIDMFTVDPEYASKGVGRELGNQLVKIAKGKRVDGIFAIISQNAYHDKSISSSFHIGLQPLPTPFTFVAGSVNKMAEKLGV